MLRAEKKEKKTQHFLECGCVLKCPYGLPTRIPGCIPMLRPVIPGSTPDVFMVKYLLKMNK